MVYTSCMELYKQELSKLVGKLIKSFMGCGKFFMNHLPKVIYIYAKEALTDTFPLHFCKTRWIEDKPVAARAIQLCPHIVKVIQYWLSLPVSKQPKDNKSYETLVKHHNDPLMIAKLSFFKYVASILKGFLVQFQSDKPMVPFLAKELDSILRKLMCLFVERKVLTEASTPLALTKVDLDKKKNHLPLSKIQLGTAVTFELVGCDVSDDKKVKFKNECLTLLVGLIEKLVERCPLRYNIVRHSSCFDPFEMVNHTDACILKANRLIDIIGLLG